MLRARKVSKKVFLSLVLCSMLCGPSKQLRADLSSKINNHQVVAITELLDATTRALKIVKMTSKKEDDINLLALTNVATSALVIFSKLRLPDNPIIIDTMPNIFDLLRNHRLSNAAKKISKNNRNKTNLKINKKLLALLAIESGLSITGKGIVGFVADTEKAFIARIFTTIASFIFCVIRQNEEAKYLKELRDGNDDDDGGEEKE